MSVKEYIATSDPQKGGAYVRNISELTQEECEKIKKHFLSIETAPGTIAVSVYPMDSFSVALCVTQKKTSLEEPRLHSVSHGLIIRVSEFASEFAAMESDGFAYLAQKLDDHDNPVSIGYQSEGNCSFNKELQYSQTYSAEEKINMFYAVLELLESGHKILLSVSEDEKTKWMAMFYSILPQELITELLVSTGEIPMNPPTILLADHIRVQQNEDDYRKVTPEQFIRSGEKFRKQQKLAFPYLETCIGNAKSFEKLQKCSILKSKYHFPETALLEQYDMLLQLLEADSENEATSTTEMLIQRLPDQMGMTADKMLKEEFPHLYSEMNRVKMLPQIPFCKFNMAYGLLAICKGYMEGEPICLRKEILNHQLNESEWHDFQKKLRVFLERYKVNWWRRDSLNRYVDLIFLAFQFAEKGESRMTRRNIWCCYDLNKIKSFCRKKGIFSRRKLKREIKRRLF